MTFVTKLRRPAPVGNWGRIVSRRAAAFHGAGKTTGNTEDC